MVNSRTDLATQGNCLNKKQINNFLKNKKKPDSRGDILCDCVYKMSKTNPHSKYVGRSQGPEREREVG